MFIPTVCQSVLHPICIVQCHVATDLCYSGDTALSALEGDEFQCSRDETSQKLLYNVAVLTYICFGAGRGEEVSQTAFVINPPKLLDEGFHQTLLNVIALILLCPTLICSFL